MILNSCISLLIETLFQWYVFKNCSSLYVQSCFMPLLCVLQSILLRTSCGSSNQTNLALCLLEKLIKITQPILLLSWTVSLFIFSWSHRFSGRIELWGMHGHPLFLFEWKAPGQKHQGGFSLLALASGLGLSWVHIDCQSCCCWNRLTLESI